MINISGNYTFTEDFGYGTDIGKANFQQNGSEIEGTIDFVELIEGDEPFTVICELKGHVNGNEVEIDVLSFKTDDVEYYPESRKGMVNDKGQIVGSSEDEQGVCGVFVFTPIT